MDMNRYSDNLADIKIGKIAEEKSSVVGRIQKFQSEIDKDTGKGTVKKMKDKQVFIE